MSIINNIARAKTDYNEVYEAGIAEGKASVYESITFTSDIANALEFYNSITPFISENDTVVMFRRKDFNGVPSADAPRGLGLWFLWQKQAYAPNNHYASSSSYMRWIDGAYSPALYFSEAYLFVVPAGSEYTKVVLK